MESGSKEWLGRSWIFLMGLALASAGAFFSWWLWAASERARAMDAWREVPAEVVSSSVRETRYNAFSQTEFEPVVRYRYSVGGQTFTGDRIRRVPVRSSSREKAERWVKRFPAGALVRACVDPRDPARAVLKKNSKAGLYAIWFPLLFAAAGLRMCWDAVRGSGAGRRVTHTAAG